MFKRHAVRLDGVCHLRGGTAVGVEIQDMCLGGMYLLFRKTLNANQSGHPQRPETGDVFELECFVPVQGKQHPIRLKARAVRCFAEGIGVAFHEPDIKTLTLLNKLINTVSTGQPKAPDKASGGSGSQQGNAGRDRLVTQCKDMMTSQSATLVDRFLTAVDERMFTAAAEAKNNAEQNMYFDAMGIVKKNEQEFRKTFSSTLMAELDTLTIQPHEHSTQGSTTAPDSELSIMAEDSLERWLAAKDIINLVQKRNHDVLGNFEQRLATLFTASISKDNNPFGPALFAHAFEGAVQTLDLDHNMVLFSYRTFGEVLAELSEELYSSVNEFLEQQGIRPCLKARVADAQETADEAAASDESARDDSTASSTTETTTVDDGKPQHRDQTTESRQEQVSAAGSSVQQGQETGAGGPVVRNRLPESSIAGNTGKDEPHRDSTISNDVSPVADEQISAAPTGAAKQDIYQLVRELRTLKSQLDSRNPEIADNPASQAAESAASHDVQAMPYTMDEILAALSSVQNQTADGNNASQSPSVQALELLKEKNLSSGSAKTLGNREQNILDVAGNLFDSLIQDMLVAESVRHWIKKLEIPLLKIALQDDSLFLDKNHVARRVVNSIAQLENYSSASADGAQNSIWNKVDRLMDTVARDIDVKPDIFAQVQRELEALIKVQNQAYRENLQEVVKSCELESRNEPALPSNAADKPAPVNATQPWEKQVARLQVGDWLLFHDDTAGGKRLRLAWIARHHDRFVFVNLKGLREATLDFGELAGRLRDGTVIALESADEPAIDRAQYTMLGKLHKQLVYETTHDQLTGLIDRREFEHMLNDRMARQAGTGLQNVLCYLDVDQFSTINNTYGYEAGDKLLTDMTDLLLRTLNGRGVLARVGSDAFTLLLENCTAAEARQLLQHQLETVREFRFQWTGKGIAVSLCIGLVPVTDFEASAGELMQAAEYSCKNAKKRGGNQIHIYQRNDQALAKHQAILQRVLHIDDLLEHGNIQLFCQRIAPLQSGDINRPHHNEVLVRIRDDEGNFIPTQDFILAAEHHHRIPTIDRWVIDSVLTWMSAHRNMIPELGGMAINLSGKSLNDETFMTFVQQRVAESGLPPEWICFEITETAGIASLSDTTAFIEQIKDTGCHFSLDDFGSGLSSYTYLKNLPVDYLKIDGAFVREMNRNPSDYAVVKSICEIGHFMGKQIIAEFAENQEILDLLKQIGVDYAQGYAIGKPTPLQDLGSSKPRNRS